MRSIKYNHGKVIIFENTKGSTSSNDLGEKGSDTIDKSRISENNNLIEDCCQLEYNFICDKPGKVLTYKMIGETNVLKFKTIDFSGYTTMKIESATKEGNYCEIVLKSSFYNEEFEGGHYGMSKVRVYPDRTEFHMTFEQTEQELIETMNSQPLVLPHEMKLPQILQGADSKQKWKLLKQQGSKSIVTYKQSNVKFVGYENVELSIGVFECIKITFREDLYTNHGMKNFRHRIWLSLIHI